MKLKFCPTTIFRETPKVTFFDAGIESTNGCDVVMHSGDAISPPNEFGLINTIKIYLQKIIIY